jgi:hypothetical protein
MTILESKKESKKKIGWLTVGVVAVLGVLGLLWVAVRSGERTALGRREDQSPAGALLPTSLAPSPVEAGRVASLASETDVEKFLAEVEQAARSRGRVLPEDYAQGRAAVERLRDRLGPELANYKARQFGEHLARVARELELEPIADELERLAHAIAQASDRSVRQKLVSEYRSAVLPLPPFERTVALSRLEKLIDPLEK